MKFAKGANMALRWSIGAALLTSRNDCLAGCQRVTAFGICGRFTKEKDGTSRGLQYCYSYKTF